MAIGKIIIDLEAQHAAFTKGLHEAKEKVAEIGESLESLKGIAETAFAFAGIEMGVSAIKEMVVSTVEQTAQANRLSSSLGITTQSLQELQTAASLSGVKADEFNGILTKMEKQLGGAEEGTGKAADALTRLHLSGDALKGQRLDESFIKIAEEISKVHDPLERAKDEIALFGKGGQQLDPLLSEGAEGIAKAAEEARKMGTAMSDIDNAKIMAANESFEHISLAVQGVENQLTVALAPILEIILNKILAVVPAADTMQHAFVSALRYVAEGVGIVVDAWTVLKLAGEAVSWALVSGLELQIHQVNQLGEAIVWVANKLGADWHLPAFMTAAETTVDDWRKQIQSDMATTVDDLKHPNSEKWGRFFDDVQSKANETAAVIAGKKPMATLAGDFEENGKKIESILAGLQKSIADFGLTEGQKKILELKDLHADAGDIKKAEAMSKTLDSLTQQKKITEEITKLQVEAAQVGMTEAQKKVDDLKRGGATDTQLEQAKGLQSHIDAMKAWAEEQKAANKLIEDQLPIQKYQTELDKIQKLYRDGLLTKAQADQAIDSAAKKMDKEDHGDKKATLETRRFDFRMPQPHPEKEDAAKEAAATAKQQLQSQMKVEFYQQQQYQWGLNAQQNQDVIFRTV